MNAAPQFGNYLVCSIASGDCRSKKLASLYEACKAIVGRNGGIVLDGKRLVAHWTGNEVHAGAHATEAERAQIADDADLLRVRG
jgi:hypothetical protein